ncbi:hypothetical protein SEA_YEEZY_42 [Gordonia phage Yeezy]|uniref:Uncharacterized protein n=1 Tax=Gordonia phage Yeezy TaxID=1821565 RepID=A0A142K9K4_9CAUD|nr:hypothetical protein SEA_YEEZY_42 [Gordonia phage Yeezy]AMS02787.1 hypothetical protein SEA_YEEZY_42 [Gordonia phage Yeezy]
MTPPPGAARTSSSPRSIDFSGIEDLKVAARTVLWNCGVDYGPNRINRLCVRFVNRIQGNGFDFFDFLANQVELTAQQRRSALANPDVQRVIAYADPTGETATNNVMRSGDT